MNKKELYEKFYPRYTHTRDRIILGVLKKLRAKAKVQLTSQNINEVLDARSLYERLSTAYWRTRLLTRPFIVKTKQVKYKPFEPPTRIPQWDFRNEDPYDPPAGYYWLVLDGGEYDRVVSVQIDMETRTVFLRSLNQ